MEIATKQPARSWQEGISQSYLMKESTELLLKDVGSEHREVRDYRNICCDKQNFLQHWCSWEGIYNIKIYLWSKTLLNLSKCLMSNDHSKSQ